MARQWNELAAAAAAFKASVPEGADLSGIEQDISDIEQDISDIKDEMAATAEALDPGEPEE